MQRNCRKLTILWSLFYNSFVKFYGTKFGTHNITMLCPNLVYDEVCYEGTVLHFRLSWFKLLSFYCT